MGQAARAFQSEATEDSRAARVTAVRARTEALAAPLSAEDQVVQSMPDASPVKWHLAHTTWFFDAFILARWQPDSRARRPAWNVLFNSYYEAMGARHPRPQRGLLTRPSLDEVMAWRSEVTHAIATLAHRTGADCAALIELGLHHEQQHQELLLMDIKNAFWCNPLRPAYRPWPTEPVGPPPAFEWIRFEGGLAPLGADDNGFAFDNERPRHRVWLEPFALASRPVTWAEYGAFIDDGGYRRPELWLSDGWDMVRNAGWTAPLYCEDGMVHTLHGTRPVHPHEPVCHVSHYEAAAYAKWAGARLPTEAEWERAAAQDQGGGTFDALHPQPLQVSSPPRSPALHGMFGTVWQWTASAYSPYPGFREAAGALGEYNGKFMSSQMVLRGGCAVTPSGHVRATYRNFYPPAARWCFSGIRLAMDCQ
jgi:ergothioneine biosynthesis protein EgtB